jgi:hypothetical protein
MRNQFSLASVFVGMVAGGMLLAIGQSRQVIAQAPPAQPMPRFQIAAAGDNLFVLDNSTNRVHLLFKTGAPGGQSGAPLDRPWLSDYSFSIEDAIQKKEGAVMEPGPGR